MNKYIMPVAEIVELEIVKDLLTGSLENGGENNEGPLVPWTLGNNIPV